MCTHTHAHTHTHTHPDINLAGMGESLDSKFIQTLALNTIHYEIHQAIGTASMQVYCNYFALQTISKSQWLIGFFLAQRPMLCLSLFWACLRLADLGWAWIQAAKWVQVLSLGPPILGPRVPIARFSHGGVQESKRVSRNVKGKQSLLFAFPKS